MNRPRTALCIFARALLLTLPFGGALHAQVELRLRRTFIEQLKNKVTITGPLTARTSTSVPRGTI